MPIISNEKSPQDERENKDFIHVRHTVILGNDYILAAQERNGLRRECERLMGQLQQASSTLETVRVILVGKEQEKNTAGNYYHLWDQADIARPLTNEDPVIESLRTVMRINAGLKEKALQMQKDMDTAGARAARKIGRLQAQIAKAKK